MEFLLDPDMMDRILRDFDRCGVVGEETNKLTCYVAAISRKLDDPLAVAIQSSSAAGKSSLMEAVLDFVPEEERVQYSAMTGQSLFYMGEADLSHKILAVAEGEGAERASYPLKLLQSEGKLTIASTGKDPHSGRHVTHEYHVEGPVMIFLTTTAIQVDEELLNRCLVLTVDEEREQTRAIHRLQNESQTLEGLLAREDRQRILKLHRNAQRLLRPLQVVNPYAPQLTFPESPDADAAGFAQISHDHQFSCLLKAVPKKDLTRMCIAAKKIYYIRVDLDDIAVTNRLVRAALGRSLDELPAPDPAAAGSARRAGGGAGPGPGPPPQRRALQSPRGAGVDRVEPDPDPRASAPAGRARVRGGAWERSRAPLSLRAGVGRGRDE